MKNITKPQIVILSVLTMLILGTAAIFFFVKSSVIPGGSSVGSPGNKPGPRGDINRDGSVNTDDAELIRKASPCNHVDPCWNKVVGKTRDGDNPIYTFDLDINHDDNVNELDTSAMISE